ncbi:type II toxin-antitoxin system RelE/ParE family toxin [Alkalinema pantanalense CENA528]|uniref:type II toxin-antitoxin system RelE/ParE family toxin n=1 Tax=Alkalinema pantanalense TaxID=1620705 RepID=UPI003D6ED46E
MPELIKRPIVIQDLLNIATYISYDNLDSGDRFLYAAEATFKLIAKTPGIGRFSGFRGSQIAQIRQYPVKGFNNYLVLYELTETTIDIVRVVHGARDLEQLLLEPENPEDE